MHVPTAGFLNTRLNYFLKGYGCSLMCFGGLIINNYQHLYVYKVEINQEDNYHLVRW